MTKTQEQNFLDYSESEGKASVEDIVFKAIIYLENATDMEISMHIDMERNFVTRARTDLVEKELVKQGISRTCKINGRYVQTWEVGKEEYKKPKCLTGIQMQKIEKMIFVANDFQREQIIKMCKEVKHNQSI